MSKETQHFFPSAFKAYLLTIICFCTLGNHVLAINQPLEFPPTYQVPPEEPAHYITLSIATGVILTDENFIVRSYEFNGSVPGPTIRCRPGQTLIIELKNNLPLSNSPDIENEPSGEDKTNLHLHGLYISGEIPSDDVTIDILPQTSRSYVIDIPPEQMPGTFWVHPHSHGSTALQVGGGAALAFIVDGDEDIEGFPESVKDAPEILLVLQEFNTDFIDRLNRDFQKNGPIPWLWFFRQNTDEEIEDEIDGFILVNGKALPVITMTADRWYRLRFINAGWDGEPMEIVFEGTGSNDNNCEMMLFAKDGIIIQDFPRDITTKGAKIPLGGRADVLVRCPPVLGVFTSNTTYDMKITQKDQSRVAGIVVAVPDGTVPVPLESWTPDYPEYLASLMNVSATPGCSCETALDIFNQTVDDQSTFLFTVNGYKFNASQRMHSAFIGSVVERNITSAPLDDHPYHQHVYPFQMIEIYSEESEYDKPGDWHDTFQGDALIRYNPKKYVSKIMVHCHKLRHEDFGMMSIDQVTNTTDDQCSCMDPVTPPNSVPL